jgi:hypothetical protein
MPGRAFARIRGNQCRQVFRGGDDHRAGWLCKDIEFRGLLIILVAADVYVTPNNGFGEVSCQFRSRSIVT